MTKSKFTLLELLIVVAIIAILVSILLPSLNKSRYMARAAICSSNLKQSSIALTSYSASYNQHIPDRVGGTPEYHRYFYKRKNKEYIMLGKLWQTGFLSSPEGLFCPEANLANSGSSYTYDYYVLNGDFDPEEVCLTGPKAARSTYIVYPYSVSDWDKLFMSQFDNEEMFIADSLFNKNNGQKFSNHQFNGATSWNIMRVDGSLKFIKNSTAQSYVSLHDLYNNWAETEFVRDTLLDHF